MYLFFVLILIHKIFYIFNKEFFAYFLFLYFTNTYPKEVYLSFDAYFMMNCA